MPTNTSSAIATTKFSFAIYKIGIEAIPKQMRHCVLTCDTITGKHPRPDFLHPRQVDKLIPQLLA